MIESEQNRKRYVFTAEELKKALGIEGNITGMGLWSGRCPNDVEDGVSPDVERWFIQTEDIDYREV